LARAGDYRGWPIIAAGITNAEERFAQAAVLEASYFVGMKDAAGKEMDIARELELLSARMPPKAQAFVPGLVKDIRKLQADRAKSHK
jgi:hypothetical protein